MRAMTRRFRSRQLTQLRRKICIVLFSPAIIGENRDIAYQIVMERTGSRIRDFYVNYPAVLHHDRSLCPDVIKRRCIHVYRLHQKL